jgi:hypothetical protein
MFHYSFSKEYTAIEDESDQRLMESIEPKFQVLIQHVDLNFELRKKTLDLD